MSVARAKQKIEDSLNYLDATIDITDTDNANIDFVKDLLDQAIQELEKEKGQHIQN